MKMKLSIILIVLICVANSVTGEEASLKTQMEKVSYIIGVELGENLKRQGVDINPDIVLKGMKDSLSGTKPLLSEKEMQETNEAFRKEMMAKQQELAKVLGEKNKKEGEAFLAENKKKEGVTTLPSGLQYRVVKAGSGKKPTLEDTVTLHYRGTLIDATEFDSSYVRGTPATFPVKGIIPGFSEALQLMQEGAKWQVFIPSNLAYGDRGAGPKIGPNATLIFEIELISIVEKK